MTGLRRRRWLVLLGLLSCCGRKAPPPGPAPATAEEKAPAREQESRRFPEVALAAADLRVRIPMSGRVDSLNVTTAVSIALYHFRRGLNP